MLLDTNKSDLVKRLSSTLIELVDSLNELKQEVFNINIQKLAGQFEDTSQISKKKKDIARVKTMMSKHKNEVSNA